VSSIPEFISSIASLIVKFGLKQLIVLYSTSTGGISEVISGGRGGGLSISF
jgi:hypothetical protein